MTEAIVLAGGLGTRLRQVVPELPKPMAPVNGRPFLEHLLDYWVGQGVNRFILSVGYKRDAIIGHFGHRYRNADIVYAIEDQPLGTGGGLLAALGQLKGCDPFLAMNGDTFFEVELGPMRRFHDTKKAEITIALRKVGANNRYAGVSVYADGKITAFDSQARTAGDTLINGGVYLATRSVFAEMASQIRGPVSIEDQLYPRLLSAGRRIYGYPSQGRFIDIGIPEDYHRAAALLRVQEETQVSPAERLKRNLVASILAKQQLLADTETLALFSRAVEAVIERYRRGGRIYIAGNGGSAADAQHLAAEFVSKLARNRAPLPAEALTVDSSVLTAIGNDYGYDLVFARQLAGKATEKDVFLGITTSGRSLNILKALEQCRAMGMPSIVFCGRDGGAARAMADYCIVAPGVATSAIQEVHIVLAHSLCECVESAVFG